MGASNQLSHNPSPSHNRTTILLVEDNEGDIELVHMALASHDYELMAMCDATEALEYLQNTYNSNKQMPHLILLDLNMPKMHGKIFLEHLKQDNRFASIPVLLLTSSTASQDIQDCYRLEAKGYIVKPSNASQRLYMAQCIVNFFSNAAAAKH